MDVEHTWADAQHVAATEPAADPPPAPQPDPTTRLVGVREPVDAIGAFEQIYRTNPDEFRTIATAAELTPEARRTLAAMLMLSAPAREALVEVLRLPDDVRAVVTRVLELPPEARDTLRVFLTA
jgi:hypothetical protein